MRAGHQSSIRGWQQQSSKLNQNLGVQRLARLVLYCCAVSTLLFGSSAYGHRFFWNQGSNLSNAYQLDAAQVSSYIIGHLEPHDYHVYQAAIPVNHPLGFAILAPYACQDFLPELWVLGTTLLDDEQAPFPVPEGYKANRMLGEWRPYRDYLLNSRLGPGVRASLGESDYYLVIYAGETSGYYMAVKVGVDGLGGTSEGFSALARFIRCDDVLD